MFLRIAFKCSILQLHIFELTDLFYNCGLKSVLHFYNHLQTILFTNNSKIYSLNEYIEIH